MATAAVDLMRTFTARRSLEAFAGYVHAASRPA